MSETHTITHATPGPVELALAADVATVVVNASPDYAFAQVTLNPEREGDDEATRLVQAATMESRGDRLTVTVPRSHSSGGTTVVRNHYGNVTVAGDMVVGSVVGMVIGGVNHGVTIVNDQFIDGSGTIVIGGGGGVRIHATVPAGSTVTLTGRSPNLTARGELAWVEAETVSGDLDVSAASAVDLRTTSGDIDTDACGTVRAKTVSGDVKVRNLDGSAHVRTVSGDVAIRAVADSTVTAQTVSGDIDLAAPRGVEIDASTRSVSGRTSNRRWSA
ncbi:DUF4097 family beta strand repeat-containing protein [Amycolatopsis sp. NPDC059090]|uniref:DUF4097 family beta strand repeat-containing protein n=1 Tax=unclassified Amycolatopsis TaxID=2618356 RepID=UPI00366B72E5